MKVAAFSVGWLDGICGVWSAECGVRSVECGVRSAECGVQSVENEEYEKYGVCGNVEYGK